MAAFEEIKHIDAKTKDTINGYLRRLQSLLPSNTIYHVNTPALICCWCLLYFHVKESFDKENVDEYCSLSGDDKIVTKIKKDLFASNSTFLTNIVESGVHKWTFKLVQVNRLALVIGVWKGKELDQDKRTSLILDGCSKNYAYGYMVTHKLLIPGENNNRILDWTDYKCKSGDILEMFLDLYKRELSYSVNDIPLGIAYQDIEQTCYRAAVTLWDRGDCVELLSYSSRFE